MNTTPEQAVGGRRRRRLHSDEFKANAVASCMRPGMSMAAVAMANGVNANLLRRWVRAAEMHPGAGRTDALPDVLTAPARRVAEAPAAFIPMQLPAKTAAADIRIDAMWLAVEPVDMRAGADRLIARVVQVFGAAQAHHGYLFANARGTRMKLVVHDGFGVWCATRRLNQGRFVWPTNGIPLQPPTLTRAQFDALVVGLPWQRLEHMQAITRV